MPLRNCRPLGAPTPAGGITETGGGGGGGTATVDFNGASIQTDEQFACAFDAAGDLVGWVFRSIEDNLGEASTTAVTAVLIFQGVNGLVINPYDPAAQGHTLGNCETSSGAFEFDCRALIDDVNGDGTEYVSYFEAAKITCDANGDIIRTVTGLFTDKTMTTPYVPVNPTSLDALGGEAVGIIPGRHVISGAGSWNLPNFATAFTVITRSIGDPANPPTITDASGTTDLHLGSEDWGAEWGANQNTMSGSFTVTTTHPNDLVTIIYTTLETT